jgi:hypothetical protein
MALEYVGGVTGQGTGASYTISLNGTLTGGIASSPSPGDVVVVASGFGGTANGTASLTVSGNSTGAYTAAHAGLYSDDTWDTNFRVFYARQGATPDTQLTIERVSNTAYGGATAVHVWRGVDPTTPMDVTPVTATGINGSRPNPPAITPITPGAVVLACGCGMQTSTGSAFTVPSGMQNGVSVNSDGSTSDCGTFIASISWTSGSYDPAQATGGTTSTSSSWAASTLALRPESMVTATLSATMAGVSLSAASELPIGASLSRTLDGVTAPGAAELWISASLEGTTDGVSLSATGTVSDPTIQGQLDAALGGVALSAASELPVRASVLQTMAGVTLSGTLEIHLSATLGQTLGGLSLDSTGELPIGGQCPITLEGVSLNSVAEAAGGDTGRASKRFAWWLDRVLD